MHSKKTLFLGILTVFTFSFGVISARDLDDSFGVRIFNKNTNTVYENQEYLEVGNKKVKISADRVVAKKKNGEFQIVNLNSGEKVEDKISELKSDQNFEYVEPDYIAEAFFVPNDTYYGYQWHFDNPVYGGVGAEEGWNYSNGAGVVVAVLDTGVAYEDYGLFKKAPDLLSSSFVSGYDFVNGDTHPNDDNGHGTHVAGTIAGATNNGSGVAGLSYGAKIMPVKVLNKSGSGSYFDIASGIRFAADNGAKVINLSLGGSATSTYLEEALQYAYGKGVVIVAASGNENVGNVSYPAAYDDYVIAVGATRYDEARAPYSNYGSSLDVVAPGGDLSVDQNSDGYGDGVLQQTFSGSYGSFGYFFFQGTSMATPHVSALAAMIIGEGINSPALVKEAIENSAKDLGAPGRDDVYGHGLISTEEALIYAGATIEPPPVWTTVFQDSFEVAEWNGLWTEDIQNDWFRSSQRATDGFYSAEVDGGASDANIKTVVNLGGKTNARVSFSWLIESSLDKGEYLAFDVSTDNGATWIEQKRLRGNVDQENTWHNVSQDFYGINNLQLRFRGKMSHADEDANIDNVKAEAY